MDKLHQYHSSLSDKEIQKIIYLLEGVFKKKFTFEYINWLYNENPYGKAICCNIEHNRKIVGHYAIIPLDLKINNVVYKSALSLNSAVDNNYRGKGFFKILAKKTFDIARKKKIKFIFGVSNQQSTKLFVKYFDFENLGQLEAKFGFGSVKKLSRDNTLKVNWNDAGLAWRLKNPKFVYKYRQKKNNLIILNDFYKFFSIQMGEFNNIKNFHIIKENTSKQNFNFFNLYIGRGNYHWKKSFFLNFPNFLKPSPLNLIIKNITEKKKIFTFDKNKIYFQAIDFDAF